ncbi:YajG family lipoprotein [Kistimonas scapharcae]|uniref:YajG family lipoprotein n=1 Tax=Kistimonas scapharcae TaxID=1036133 RepID=A0ABP8V7I2_9GAMM
MKKWLLPLSLTVLLGGCILGPQTVEVVPDIKVAERTAQLSGPVAVTVYDERTTPQLGTRGGIYKTTNFIYLDEHFAQSIKVAVDNALRSMGMEPVSSTEVPQVQVYMDELSYAVPYGDYISGVDLKAAIRVEILKDGRRYAGRYVSEDHYRTIKAPSDSQNEEMVNAIINKVLARAMDDQTLLNFLSGTTGS